MKRRNLIGALTAILALGIFPAAAAASEPSVLHGANGYQLQVPLGLDPDSLTVPATNPLSAAKVELGTMLYFDARLSSDGTIACSSCHDPAKGFTDQKRVSNGVGSKTGTRNAPTVINTAFNIFQFWDGRAPSLEEQAKGPIANPVEMASTLDVSVQNIARIAGYRPYFEKAFGDQVVTVDRVVQAIASYERTVLSGNSAWDRFIDGDKKALSDSAQRGLHLFEGKALCTRCHVGFNLTDGLFHNIGVGMAAQNPDLGRFVVSKEEKDKGAFKTPTLRDLLRTAPYMHDGSVQTIEEVIDFYDKGGEKNQWLDAKIEPLHLTAEEKTDLAAFLRSLEGDWKPTPTPKLPE